MTELLALTTTRAALLADSWKLALRAENKSPGTIKVYADGVRRYLAWCTQHGSDPNDPSLTQPLGRLPARRRSGSEYRPTQATRGATVRRMADRQ